MTIPKHQNSLYIYLKSITNQAVPLEYAIRAARLQSGTEIDKLMEINNKIKQQWIAWGANEQDIKHYSLMDTTWDYIQVGLRLKRGHRQYVENGELYFELLRKLPAIKKLFISEINELNIPATRYYRIADLLQGNDVLYMIKAVARGLEKSQNYELTDEINIDEFPGKIREPVHLHPGARYFVPSDIRGNAVENKFALILDLELSISPADLKRQVREFLYRYALHREARFETDPLAKSIISDFNKKEMQGQADEHFITRLDGFLSVLTGIYCWDQAEKFRKEKKEAPLEKAISETLKIYPKNVRQVGEDTIRKNYNLARKSIKEKSF